MSVSTLWPCPRCTVQNKPTDKKCAVCYLPRDASEIQTQAWQCLSCLKFNPASVTECPRCGFCSKREKVSSVKAVAPDEEARWICESEDDSGGLCGTTNSIKLSRCSQCQAKRLYFSQLVSEEKVENELEDAMKETFKVSVDGQGSAGENQEPSPVVPSLEATVLAAEDMPAGSLAPDDDQTKTADSVGELSVQGRETTEKEAPNSTEDSAAAAAVAAIAAAGDHSLDQSMQAELAPIDDEVLKFPDEECRLVLVGKTGNGKSHTANTILGLPRFQHDFSFHSVTTRCQRHNNLRFGIRLEVVDTPGLFDTKLDDETVQREIAKCLAIVAPGPHAVLVVVRSDGKFTKEEIQAVEKLDETFGEQLTRFLIVVFTHGDQLKKKGDETEEMAVRRMLDDSPQELQNLVKRVNERYVVIDNMASEVVKAQQVKKLIGTVSRLMAVNGGKPYSTELLDVVERCMHRRERELEERLQGRRRRRRRGSSPDHPGPMNLEFRDIVRGEVVQDSSPLLTEIRTQIVPLIAPTLQFLATRLMEKVLDHVVKSTCSVM